MFAKFKCNSRGWACGGEGIVQVKKVRRCNLRKVLFVPINLRKTTQFDKRGCQILTDDGKVIAVAKRVGNLYYLECKEKQNMSALVKSKERRAESDKTGKGWPHQMFRLRLLKVYRFLRNLYWR